MNYVVAVSGGVDSVVLLDMLARSGGHDLTVAHFDHGIRSESAADASFVRGLAERYGLPFVTERAELGAGSSEETARTYRYAFLRRVAESAAAKITTAHHQDDLIESVVINLTRGTGWRGLAVLNDLSIERPLLTMRKSDLYEYAMQHGLEWVEDETNGSDVYLRNRIRKRTSGLAEQLRRAIAKLRDEQCDLAAEIEHETQALETSSRYFMTMIDEAAASELLRHILSHLGLSLTRPQRIRLLLAIRTARPGTTFQAGDGVTVGFTAREFIVKHP